MPMDKDVAAIAEGLSEAQRLVLHMEPWPSWAIFTHWPDHLHRAMQQLQIAKVFDWAPFWNSRWNETGLAVREYLTLDGGKL